MKWFKHDTDGNDSEGIKQLQDRFGFHKGYALWFMTLEMVAEKMDSTDRCHLTLSVKDWCRELRLNTLKLNEYLVLSEYILNIKVVFNEDKLTIEIPNLLKKRDEYSRKSGHSTNNVPPKSKEVRSKIKDKEKDLKDSTSKNKFSDDDLLFSKRMFKDIKVIYPRLKEPNFETWANAIRLMREVDKIKDFEIDKVWTWANKDSFWYKNILSPAKLREKFGQLELKMNSNGKPKKEAPYDHEYWEGIENAKKEDERRAKRDNIAN